VEHGNTVEPVPGTPDRRLVQGATARVCNVDGNHKGQGLVLAIGGCVVVLTCHHVIADIPPDAVRIALPDGRGGLQSPLNATLDSSRSRPERDAVVLRIPINTAPPRPLLHALDPAVYDGTLPKRATGYTHMTPQTFDARVSTATRLDLPVTRPGVWPDPPQRYLIPNAFRLAEPTDVRKGVSGAVVTYEGGVLGLAHFARAAKSEQERELYLVPLSTWAESWEELHVLIEPLIDQPLRNAAIARRVRDVKVGISNPRAVRNPDVVIAGFREGVYVKRPQEVKAQQALAAGGLLIIGRPKSGKTRLAWEVIRKHPDAVLVIPRKPMPPQEFETAGLSGRQVIIFCDDLHSVAEQFQPLYWCDRFRTIASTVYVIATSRDGLEWKRVRDNQATLLDTIDDSGRIFVSQTGNTRADLPHDMGEDLARQLGLREEDFLSRFDGTPGSLTLGLDGMRERYHRLRDEQLGKVAGSRLLDSLKILYVAGQADLNQQLARAVAEQIRGDGRIGAETWEGLCRRTQEEGFGAFTEANEFQTYHPYLEKCVEYVPTATEFDDLYRLLHERDEPERLFQLAIARQQGDEVRRLSYEAAFALAGSLMELYDLSDIRELWIQESPKLGARFVALENYLTSLPGTDNEQVYLISSARAAVERVSETLRIVINIQSTKSNARFDEFNQALRAFLDSRATLVRILMRLALALRGSPVE
jgi:hypothetical protein